MALQLWQGGSSYRDLREINECMIIGCYLVRPAGGRVGLNTRRRDYETNEIVYYASGCIGNAWDIRDVSAPPNECHR